MAERQIKTGAIRGGAQYAFVKDRLKQFRTDFPKGKIETDYHTDPNDASLTVFKAWVWKDKTDLIDIMKSGTTDKEILRSSADADGSAKSKVGVKEKDFEKLQTVALGRALASLGYLGSGEIASFEEMEEFDEYKENQLREYVDSQLELLLNAPTLDDLKNAWMANEHKEVKELLEAKDKRKIELAKKEGKKNAVK